MSPSAKIFAAIDAGGAIRFIGDVPSGAACACFCSVCRSSLIARHGSINTWHFAHEALQERPECIPGALNLLRHLAVEHLKSLINLILPTYRQDVTRALPSGRVVEIVQWDAQPVSVTWLDAPAQDAPVARLAMDNDIVAELFVEIAEARPALRYPTDSGVGKIVFWSTLPVDSDLRKELYARQHIRRSGQLVWVHQPDVYGLVADALKKLAARAEREELDAAARAQREREAFDRYRLSTASRPPEVPEPPKIPLWARLKKLGVPFFAYQVRSGEAWVIFELAQGGFAIRELAGADGWEEAVPASVGRFDPVLQVVVSDTRPQFNVVRDVVGTRISSDFRDITQL